MRGISRLVLARDLSAALTAAACKGLGEWWSAREAEHARAQTRAQAAAAAAPALAICRNCPELVSGRCAQLAEVDDYTGLSAGAAYRNGRRRHPAIAVPAPEIEADLVERAG